MKSAIPDLTPADQALFEQARALTRRLPDRDFVFYLPGMVKLNGERGCYPVISLTGADCELQCEHCRGRLLAPMLKVSGPQELIEKCRRLHDQGAQGVLLSGGADQQGRLPWDRYLEAIAEVRSSTSLFLSAHVGFPDAGTCRKLRQVGIRQALLDVMGDDETASRVYHLPGLATVRAAIDAINDSGLEFVPHIVAGLFYGRIQAEDRALEMIASVKPAALVIVVLTPFKKTAMEDCVPPSPLDVARLIARARLLMPEVPLSLGCERPRNQDGVLLERLAIRAGITRMAVWSEEAIADIHELKLKAKFQKTCCSVAFQENFSRSDISANKT